MRPTIQQLRLATQRNELDFRGSIRRMLLAGSEGALATVAGGADADGNEDREDGVEVFGVAGVRSRVTARGEAIVVRVGGRGGHTVVVATRDRGMEAAGDLDEDEIAIETSRAFLVIKASGDILIGRPDGVFEKVATESHVHLPGTFANGGGAVVGTSGKAVANPGTAPGEATLSGRGVAATAHVETAVP